MAKLTQQQTLAAHFLKIGEKEIFGRSSKYRVFTRTRYADWVGTPWTADDKYRLTVNGPLFWYVGKSGALRTGHNSSTSITMENMKRRILHPEIKAVTFIEKTAQE